MRRQGSHAASENRPVVFDRLLCCVTCVFSSNMYARAPRLFTALCVSAHAPTRVQQMCVFVCVRRQWFDGLTDDDGGDLVPAGPVLVLHLADESGVDGVVHLPHRQLVAVHHHRVGQRAGGPAGEGEGEGGRTEGGVEYGEEEIC